MSAWQNCRPTVQPNASECWWQPGAKRTGKAWEQSEAERKKRRKRESVLKLKQATVSDVGMAELYAMPNASEFWWGPRAKRTGSEQEASGKDPGAKRSGN